MVIAIVAFATAWAPGTTDDRVRYTGMCLEIFGILTVAAGLKERGKLFERPSLFEFFRGWIQRIPRWHLKPHTIYATGIGSAGGVGSVTGFGWVSPPPTATIEERVVALERNIQATQQLAVDAQQQVRAEAHKRQTEIETERSTRDAADKQIRAQLESFAAGNLNIEWVGIVWLLFGVILATASKEVALILQWVV